MKKLVTWLILILPFLNFGQTLTTGLIITEIDSLKYAEKNCCILSPENGFTAYDKPNGKIIGKIKKIGTKEENDLFTNEIYFVGENKTIKLKNYTEIGYEIYALNFSEASANFVKLESQSTIFWIDTNEIEALGFKAINWMDYLVLNSENVLGYYANEPGLRIRREPNTTSEIMGSARGDLFEIKLTNTISGKWAKVTVTKYKEHICNTDLNETDNIEYTTEGWMKIIDDNGTPNIWHYTRGC